MQELKELFLKAISENPDLLDIKWAELERRFNIPPTGRPGDRARRWWRTWEENEKGIIRTFPIKEGPYWVKLNEAKQEVVTETVERDQTGLRLKSVWQVQGKGGVTKTLKSYFVEPQALEDGRKQLIEDVSKFSPKVSLKHDSGFSDENLLELAIPDLHIGRQSLEETRKLFMDTLQELLYEAANSYAISKIVFPIGNDVFNSDFLDYKTTKGTAQFDKDQWFETFRFGWQLIAEGVTLASTIAPVEVVVVAGNHDRMKVFFLGDLIDAYFRNNENVTVNNSNDPFKFIKFGTTLIGYNHGELKPAQYPMIMATEQKENWSKCDHFEWHLGHYHREQVLNEDRSIKLRYLPSISPNSDWETQQGYKHKRQAQALLWNKDRGLRNIYYCNV